MCRPTHPSPCGGAACRSRKWRRTAARSLTSCSVKSPSECTSSTRTIMAKGRLAFSCSACGGLTPKWAGQCPDCGAWNTLEEHRPVAAAPSRRGRAHYAGDSGVRTLAEVPQAEEARFSTGNRELDRVLGGGLVVGGVVLLGGDPGIGKSTLLLQSMAELPEAVSVLYVTGEESLRQVALRASRLSVSGERLKVSAETAVEAILAAAEQERPQVVVIDSIQTMFSEQLQSAPGSVSQVRESAALLVRYAKQSAATL